MDTIEYLNAELLKEHHKAKRLKAELAASEDRMRYLERWMEAYAQDCK